MAESAQRSKNESSKPKVIIVREYETKNGDNSESSLSTGGGTIRHIPPLSDSGTQQRPLEYRQPRLRLVDSSRNDTKKGGRDSPQNIQRRIQSMKDDASYWEPPLEPPKPSPATQVPPIIIVTPDDEDGIDPEPFRDSNEVEGPRQQDGDDENEGDKERHSNGDRMDGQFPIEDVRDGQLVNGDNEDERIYRDTVNRNDTREESSLTSESEWDINNSNTMQVYSATPLRGLADPLPTGGEGGWGIGDIRNWVATRSAPDLCMVPRRSQETRLTHGETICLEELQRALDNGNMSRAAFIVQSVANKSQVEWQRLYGHLGPHHQRILVNSGLQPDVIVGVDGDRRHNVLQHLEVEDILGRYHLTHVNGHRQDLPSMSQEKTEDAVEEVRKRYESELSLLKQKNQAHPTRENVLLQKSDTLENQLKKANNEISFLKDQVHGLRVQLGVWPDRVRQLEEENATLKEKLSDCRTANQQCRRELMSTQDRLQETLHQQQFSSVFPSNSHNVDSRLSSADHRLMQRVLEDYDTLQREHDRVRTALAETEGRLYETRNESCEHAKKVASLEMDVQRLETENHALRRRSIYEMARPSPPLSSINGVRASVRLRERDISPTASIRARSSSRPTLYRELSLERPVLADDISPEEKAVPDIMTMSLPPAALEAALSSGRETPRPHSPPVRLPPGNSTRLPPSYHDVKMLERQYDKLQQEKRRLEAGLSHLPNRALNPRLRREIREERERLEASLESTDRQIGSIRMTLRQYNVLKSSI